MLCVEEVDGVVCVLKKFGKCYLVFRRSFARLRGLLKKLGKIDVVC